jgi:hypothetical protein
MGNIPLTFEHDFQKKIMQQAFTGPYELDSLGAVVAWRAAWTSELKSWHSPYKALVDCRHLKVSDEPKVVQGITTMLKFFEGLFLKQIIGYGFDESLGHKLLPWEMFATADEAGAKYGLGRVRQPSAHQDFRSQVQLQNHFAQHVVELSFAEKIEISAPEQLDILKSKLTNNLMQWHSKWSLLVDCTNISFSEESKLQFAPLDKYLKGFFMKAVIGYSPSASAESYPFPVYRARHKAVAQLEAEGNFMGNDALCKSKVPNTK